MSALYVLAHEMRATAERLCDASATEEEVDAALAGLADAVEQKAIAVAMVARNIEADAAAIKEAERQMSVRRKAMEARADRLRRYLHDNMKTAGILRVSCPHFALAIKNKPAAVDVFDAAQVPAEFMRQPEPPPPEPDKRAIAEAMKAGLEVAGCRFSNDTTRLEIK